MWLAITISIIVAIFVLLYLCEFSFETIGMSLVSALLAYIISSIVILGISCVVRETESVSYEQIYVKETALIALKDNVLSTGHGYLYRGYINDKLKYTYLYEVPEKGITSNSISADKAYINYIPEDEIPKLITRTCAPSHWFVDFVTFDCIAEKTEYTLCVPSGSIVVEGEYEIDLE